MNFKEEQEKNLRTHLQMMPLTEPFIVLIGPIIIILAATLANAYIENIGIYLILYLTWAKLLKIEIKNIKEER